MISPDLLFCMLCSLHFMSLTHLFVWDVVSMLCSRFPFSSSVTSPQFSFSSLSFLLFRFIIVTHKQILKVVPVVKNTIVCVPLIGLKVSFGFVKILCDKRNSTSWLIKEKAETEDVLSAGFLTSCFRCCQGSHTFKYVTCASHRCDNNTLCTSSLYKPNGLSRPLG